MAQKVPCSGDPQNYEDVVGINFASGDVGRDNFATENPLFKMKDINLTVNASAGNEGTDLSFLFCKGTISS